jgi:hypothetical protein
MLFHIMLSSSARSGLVVRDITNKYIHDMAIFWQARVAHWWYSWLAYWASQLANHHYELQILSKRTSTQLIGIH